MCWVFFCVPVPDVPQLFLGWGRRWLRSATLIQKIELLRALRIPAAQCFSLIIFVRCFVWYTETGTSVAAATAAVQWVETPKTFPRVPQNQGAYCHPNIITRMIIIKITIIIIINKFCAQIHFNICKETGVQLDKKHWYVHVPKSVETSNEDKVTILWNQQVQTDRTIPNNKPDIIRDNEAGTCM